MSFVNAIPLAAVIGLPLIPLALHLLTRQRLQTVELATFRFLFDSYVRQRRRTRFLEALIAALRVLCVLGLVAVVARPVADTASGLLPGGTNRDVILMIDCSASMAAQADGRSALERAKEAANAAIAGLTPEDRVTLVRVAGRPEVVIHQRQSDPADLRARVAGLEPSPAAGNLFAALSAVFADERRRPANPVVYFITDSQAGSFKEVEASGADRVLPAGTPLTVVDVGATTTRGNVAVVGDGPTRQRAAVGLPVALTARVFNASAEPADATVAFLINDREVERRNLKLGPNETLVSKFAPYVPTTPGPLSARFEITTAGADVFPDDNRFAFVLPVEPKGKVLIVNGAPAADPFEDETLYLRAALAAGPGRQFANSLDVTEEPESAWAGLDEARLRARLDEFAVVVLANAGNLHRITTYAYPALRAFVQDGGGLILLPGDRVEPTSYNAALFRTPPPLREFLLPVQLGLPEGEPDRPETFRRLARIQADHPIFRPFQTDGLYFDRVLVKRRYPITVLESKQVDVLAEYADHTPAIVEGRPGDGRVILFTFPANARWTTLPVNGAEFVPLMLQTVNHVRRRAEVEGPGTVAAGDRATVSVAPGWAPVSGTVSTPRGRKVDLTFERFGGRLEASFDGTGDRGYFTTTVQSGRDPTRTATLGFAVNVDPGESDLTRVSTDRVRDLFPAAAVTFVDRSAEADRTGAPDTSRELWRFVIYALFAVIAFELLLATLGGGWYGPRASPDD